MQSSLEGSHIFSLTRSVHQSAFGCAQDNTRFLGVGTLSTTTVI